ncbi:MAG: aminotransferase class I/II-fold pyridoxal phosphate-dependent enzyme [Planctomycetes bacterium]|nr:aminotransferase class I/II-fold pyridoxal phosphate-dependent enzyme [Planctomycetota bacterium]
MLKKSKTLVSSIYPGSVYKFGDLDEYEEAILNPSEEFIYARDGHPNATITSNEITKLHAADWGIVTGSGMGAISAVFLGILSSGTRIVAGKRLYGRTLKILEKDFSRFGVKCDIVDECNLDELSTALSTPASILFIETITNPTLRVPNLKEISLLTNKNKTLLVVDNTFATPLLCKPLKLGADIVIESLTKIMCGHSDVTMGFVGGKQGTQENIIKAVKDIGFHASPFDCWLISRSLETLELRLNQSCKNAFELANWLKSNHGHVRVDFPGLENHQDFEIAKKQFGKLPGHLIAVDIPKGREGVNIFLKTAKEIPFCPSLGHSSTSVSHSWSTSHRQLNSEQKLKLKITEGLLRVSVGHEPIEQIISSFDKGLKAAEAI